MAKKQNYSYKAHRNDVLTTRMIIIFTLLLVSVFVLFKAREWISVRSWLGPIGDYGYFFTITRLLTGLCLILTALSAIHFAKLKKAGVDESLKVIPSSMLLSVSATVFAVLLAVSAFSYTGIGMSIIFIILVALLYFISVCFPGSYFNGIDCEVYCAELNMDVLFAMQLPEATYIPLPKYPSVTRDLAIVCEEAITVAQVEEVIASAAGKLLRNIRLFDIYRGTGVPEGKKSLAFSLEIRADDRTLTDSDSEALIKAVLIALEEKINAVLR